MRIVSLVPSLTEAVAATLPGALVGATDWCTHPAGLDVARVGGSKYPDLDRVVALRPDVALVNVEENREQDADALRAAGVELYVTYPRTVDQALDELGRMLTALGAPGEPARLVVLPDEPYPFTGEDGPDAFPGRSCALVSGRHLT